MTNSCHSCGRCCKLFLINLSRQEYESGKYQTMLQEFGHIDNFAQASDCGANLLAKNPDNSCIYLVDNKCSIHAIRPVVCRQFFCSTKAKKFQGMVKIIQESSH